MYKEFFIGDFLYILRIYNHNNYYLPTGTYTGVFWPFG